MKLFIKYLFKIFLLLVPILYLGCKPNTLTPDNTTTIPLDSLPKRLKDTLEVLKRINCYDIDLGKYCEDYYQKNCVYFPFNYLIDSTDKKTLQTLSRHKNAIVRAYAYSAAIYREDDIAFSILKKAMPDSSTINFINEEDKIINISVGEAIIELCVKRFWLNTYQLDSLKQTILNASFKYKQLNDVLLSITPAEKNYPLIKKLATKDSIPSAIVALAKYNKKEDKSFISNYIQSNIKTTNQAIILQIIEQVQDSSLNDIVLYISTQTLKAPINTNCIQLFKTLASKNTDRSLKELLKYTKSGIYASEEWFKLNQKSLYKALHQYYNPEYSKTYYKLKANMPTHVIQNISAQEQSTIWK